MPGNDASRMQQHLRPGDRKPKIQHLYTDGCLAAMESCSQDSMWQLTRSPIKWCPTMPDYGLSPKLPNPPWRGAAKRLSLDLVEPILFKPTRTTRAASDCSVLYEQSRITSSIRVPENAKPSVLLSSRRNEGGMEQQPTTPRQARVR